MSIIYCKSGNLLSACLLTCLLIILQPGKLYLAFNGVIYLDAVCVDQHASLACTLSDNVVIEADTPQHFNITRCAKNICFIVYAVMYLTRWLYAVKFVVQALVRHVYCNFLSQFLPPTHCSHVVCPCRESSALFLDRSTNFITVEQRDCVS